MQSFPRSSPQTFGKTFSSRNRAGEDVGKQGAFHPRWHRWRGHPGAASALCLLPRLRPAAPAGKGPEIFLLLHPFGVFSFLLAPSYVLALPPSVTPSPPPWTVASLGVTGVPWATVTPIQPCPGFQITILREKASRLHPSRTSSRTQQLVAEEPGGFWGLRTPPGWAGPSVPKERQDLCPQCPAHGDHALPRLCTTQPRVHPVGAVGGAPEGLGAPTSLPRGWVSPPDFAQLCAVQDPHAGCCCTPPTCSSHCRPPQRPPAPALQLGTPQDPLQLCGDPPQP